MNSSGAAERLRQVIGLDCAAIGTASVERAVQQRMDACGIARAAEYDTLIGRSADELQELIELVVVPETWFLRDRKPFAFLREQIKAVWLLQDPHRPVRILSVPCASGEEPYSLAAVLCDAGMSTDRFYIDAIDVSRRALALAEAACYGRNSFRYREELFLNRYLQAAEGGLAVVPELRKAVRFRQGNLLDPQCLCGGRFDIVFCRNMLIYLEADARRKVFEALNKVLMPGGLLFLGHAETLHGLTEDYERVDYRGAFAYRKRDARQAGASENAMRGLRAREGFTLRKPQPAQKQALSRRQAPLPVSPPAESAAGAGDMLSAARVLADRGDLSAAAALCQRYIADNSTGAGGHYLLGLICESQGAPDDARRCFENALYLDPEHADAAAQLALLLERCGCLRQARVCRERAARLTGAGRDG